ncbi:hypothetical protein BDV18DRAFT_153435 [Aspergillus unguis]
MAGSKILVLGGTGPAGICLLRELVYRKHETVVYARNPSKIDEDLASNELLEIIKGEMDDLVSLSTAMSKARVVISLLGPSITSKIESPTLFADMYTKSVFPLMRQHGVRRIWAMGTISISQPNDHRTLFTTAMVLFVRIFANTAYQNVLNIRDAFEKHAEGLDWTVYRIAMIPGGQDEDSWWEDRDDGDSFVGWVGEAGWTNSQKRGSLARWLVDAAEACPRSSFSANTGWKMATGSKLAIIPKMEQSPSVKNDELKNNVQSISTETDSSVLPNAAPEDDAKPVIDPELLDSELQLVSSLAKLQKLEEMIHQLRTLLPGRLLEPLTSIINPKVAAANGMPRSPQELFNQLSQSARDGVGEVNDFKALWRSKEMKGVWERVDTLIYENSGQLLQSNGMWQDDYGEMLQDIQKQDAVRQEQLQRAKEEQERSQLQSAAGGWKALVDQYSQTGINGLRVIPGKSDSFGVLLTKVGLAFKIQAIGTGQEGVPDFNVSSRAPSGEPTNVETAVLDCLNSRPRKWDLDFLLGMISSYSNIFQTPCVKCNKVQDKSANLPILRRLKSNETQPNQQPTFEAYHAKCLN